MLAYVASPEFVDIPLAPVHMEQMGVLRTIGEAGKTVGLRPSKRPIPSVNAPTNGDIEKAPKDTDRRRRGSPGKGVLGHRTPTS